MVPNDKMNAMGVMDDSFLQECLNESRKRKDESEAVAERTVQRLFDIKRHAIHLHLQQLLLGKPVPEVPLNWFIGLAFLGTLPAFRRTTVQFGKRNILHRDAESRELFARLVAFAAKFSESLDIDSPSTDEETEMWIASL